MATERAFGNLWRGFSLEKIGEVRVIFVSFRKPEVCQSVLCVDDFCRFVLVFGDRVSCFAVQTVLELIRWPTALNL